MQKIKTKHLTLTAIITAVYVVLTLPFAQFSFGIVQFRLAEALTVLAVLTPAAIPGLTLGCLLSNILNPMSLGLVDIFGGSLATFLAALLSHYLAKKFRLKGVKFVFNRCTLFDEKTMLKAIVALAPPLVLNGLIVGLYLPFLLLERHTVNLAVLLSSISSIFLCEAVVVYFLGLPLLITMSKIKTID